MNLYELCYQTFKHDGGILDNLIYRGTKSELSPFVDDVTRKGLEYKVTKLELVRFPVRKLICFVLSGEKVFLSRELIKVTKNFKGGQ